MGIAEYIAKAATVWLVGFLPVFELYVAVPTGIALGLDPVSTVLWTVLGNYAPILLIHFFYDQITRLPRVRTYIEWLRSDRFKAQVDRYGGWFVLFVTPWVGVWITAATAKLFHMDGYKMLLYMFISVVGHSIIVALLLELGIAAFRGV